MAHFNLAIIGDSNLKDVRLTTNPDKDEPYLKINGRVFCPYTVNLGHPDWLTDNTLQHYSDILFALGLNDSKKEENPKNAKLLVRESIRLAKLYPLSNIYVAAVIPSTDEAITERGKAFTQCLKDGLENSPVHFIHIHNRLLRFDGTLRPEYSAQKEWFSFDEQKKLHLNQRGLGINTN